MSGLMKAAVTLVTAVDSDARSVMVHCSDGWDRTPQIVALGELLLDPYYRTVDVSFWSIHDGYMLSNIILGIPCTD